MLSQLAQESGQLQTTYLTKEFPGYEIESKWRLLMEDPVLTILLFVKDIHEDLWHPFCPARTMGKLPIGIRYFQLEFVFFGVKELGQWKQIAMAASLPQQNLYQLAVKGGVVSHPVFNRNYIQNSPLVRKEQRTGKWIDRQNLLAEIRAIDPRAVVVGTITREKCSVYIHNDKTFRNFNISADLCRKEDGGTLSQVEIEYKGRNGIWVPDITGFSILEEFKILHKILPEQYGHLAKPTQQTKFEWVVGESY